MITTGKKVKEETIWSWDLPNWHVNRPANEPAVSHKLHCSEIAHRSDWSICHVNRSVFVQLLLVVQCSCQPNIFSWRWIIWMPPTAQPNHCLHRPRWPHVCGYSGHTGSAALDLDPVVVGTGEFMPGSTGVGEVTGAVQRQKGHLGAWGRTREGLGLGGGWSWERPPLLCPNLRYRAKQPYTDFPK